MNRFIPTCFKARWWELRARRGFLRGDGGSALVETALMLSIFGVPLLLGTVDMATVIYRSIEISNAAHAGAMYGMQSASYANQTAQMTTVAQAEATDFGTNLNVTPTMYFACSAAQSGTQYTVLATANASCTGSLGHTLAFVQVVASAPVTLPFTCCGLPASITVSRTSVMEVEGLP
jgi:Flp pilus assembly protein TadG